MQVLAIVFALLSIASISLAKECPKFTTQDPFDIKQYVGFWYEAYRNDFLFEIGNRCVNATYGLNDNGTVSVWNQAINLLGDYTSIRGSAKVKNASIPAAFVVTFDNPIQKGDYNVLTSNYVDYALVYACQNIPIVDEKFEFIWILSRTKTIPDTTFDELKKVLDGFGIDANTLKKTEQNC